LSGTFFLILPRLFPFFFYFLLILIHNTFSGGEYGLESAFPNPTAGAVLVTADGRIIGKGRSDYSQDAVWAAVLDAGLEVTPLQQWCVSWPTSASLRKDLAESTLYVTLEPSADRKGTAVPPITELIQLSGIPRVVIGSPDPVEELCAKGAAELHSSSISVNTGILFDECQELIEGYSDVANNKLQRMARTHFKQFGRPLGFLHCSVVDSDNLEEFARQGNAFSTNSGGAPLSFRNLGSYAIAPPPEFIWADGSAPGDDLDTDTLIDVDFEDEDFQGGMQSGSPMMPWYEQVDAVVATFPKQGNNGAVGDNSVTGRLNGLKWLATYGEDLPAGVERILVLDATDLADLPLTNTDPNLPKGVDVEAFWAGLKRKPTRLLLRRGSNAQARAAAEAAARAAKAAAEAAQAAADAIESGDAASAAEAAIECQKAAAAATEYIQNQLQSVQTLKRKFQDKGVIVETLNGSDPLDVMKHLGERNGLHSVVWRAGCWGERGVNAIMAGAFQWVSAHLAVDAVGGRFWQLMLAENAVQAACGPAQKVKVFADQEDISLEYCDEPDVDTDCVLSVGGRPIRHVRLDCRVALVDGDRPREFMIAKTKKLDRKTIEEAAPWFL
jgi:pyrimidine deaminase RibD-like protein